VLDWFALTPEFQAIIEQGYEVIYSPQKNGDNAWPRVRLGDMAEIKHGYAFKGNFFCDTPTKYLLVTPGNFAIGGGFQEKPKYYNGPIPENYVLAKRDLIVTMTDLSKQGDTLGFSALVPSSDCYLHNQRIGLVTIKSENILKEYVYWLMRTWDYQRYIVNHASGSTVKHTSPKTMLSYAFSLPPLPTQRAIAATLSCLDDKIELNNRINANLEAQAQAIFKSWFVDFEPFKGGGFTDSELGRIPKGWRVGRLTDIADYVNGLAMQKHRPAKAENGIPVLKIKELRQGICDINSELCSENVDDLYIVNDGDVIFSWSGSLLVDIWCGGKCGLNQHLFNVTSRKYDKWFYFLWTKYHLNNFISIATDKKTTMGHIKREHLEKSLVLIPDNISFDKISSMMQPIISTIIANRLQSRTLATIRDTLLPRLMSGEIEVKE
jgi:type I restriction enzyme S subunit